MMALSKIHSGAPLLVWNASASAPIGLYWVGKTEPLARNDLVLATLPSSIRALAAERGYLPMGVNLIKRVVALSRDQVCGDGVNIAINGEGVAKRLSVDNQHRPMPFWMGCKTLAHDDVFLLMKDVSASFDGRYFGVTSRGSVIGRLVPLWTP